jgi:trk system potassium uptake protein
MKTIVIGTIDVKITRDLKQTYCMTISRTICLGFVAIIAVGTFLLLLPISTSSGNWNDPIVALFTTTSAVCVTGLAVVDTGTYFSFWGQLFIALLAQVGGLGYMTLNTFLLILIGKRFDLRQKLAIQDSFDRPLLQGSQSLIRSIIATTLIAEITAIFIMLPIFIDDFGWDKGLWFSIFHSISAWNNAGFGLLPDSLVQYRGSIAINLAITGLIIFGGIGYQVIFEMFTWVRNKLQHSREKFMFSLNFKVAVSTTIFLLILGTIAFFLTESNDASNFANLPLKEKILAAWFQSVTTRTAGFNTIDIGKMTTAGLFVTMALMFIGASPAGTGGGIKTTTFRILASATKAILQGKSEVVVYKRTLPASLIFKAIAVTFGSTVTVIVGTILLSVLDRGTDLIKILFEVISAFGTVGLSTGITASLSSIAKVILVLIMYIGRVGVLLLMAGILGDPKPTVVKYPEDNMLVG